MAIIRSRLLIFDDWFVYFIVLYDTGKIWRMKCVSKAYEMRIKSKKLCFSYAFCMLFKTYAFHMLFSYVFCMLFVCFRLMFFLYSFKRTLFIRFSCIFAWHYAFCMFSVCYFPTFFICFLYAFVLCFSLNVFITLLVLFLYAIFLYAFCSYI